MNKAFDDLIYDSGLIASGCWEELDTYTQAAIERLIQLTVLKCADIAMREDHDPAECIKKHFGVEL